MSRPISSSRPNSQYRPLTPARLAPSHRKRSARGIATDSILSSFALKPPKKRRRKSPRLRHEALEPRVLLHAGHDHGPDYPLATAHVHANLKIFIDGDPVAIPANVGAIDNNHNPGAQMQVVHTHDVSGTLHIEPFLSPTPVTEYPTLGDFFQTWRTNAMAAGNNPNATFSPTSLMGRQANSTHEVRMYVDGRRNFDFDNYAIDEGDSITLVYTQISAPESVALARITTNVGTFDMELYAEIAPATVENFLTYAGFGDYDNTIIHRSVPGFVIQGGGYSPSGQHIPTDPPIPNEFGLSNTTNTVAMAKLGGDPNSATSEWFVNLGNNGSNLDNQNGGFTVFGRVLTPGAEPQQVNSVVAAIAALPIVDNGGARGTQPVLDTTSRTPVIIQSILPILGEIHGVVYLDIDRDGVQDNGESGQAGWTVFVDDNNNNVLDTGEISAATNSSGEYALTDVGNGANIVRLAPRTGFGFSNPSSGLRTVNIFGSEMLPDQSFGVSVQADPQPNFQLTDVNPNSATANRPVSPRDYLGTLSAWYFTHST
jgi:cyclophilin family peptidyl-prolyl cis-trans isomerase